MGHLEGLRLHWSPHPTHTTTPAPFPGPFTFLIQLLLHPSLVPGTWSLVTHAASSAPYQCFSTSLIKIPCFLAWFSRSHIELLLHSTLVPPPHSFSSSCTLPWSLHLNATPLAPYPCPFTSLIQHLIYPTLVPSPHSYISSCTLPWSLHFTHTAPPSHYHGPSTSLIQLLLHPSLALPHYSYSYS